MAVSARVPLGASTTQRKWYVDVNTGTSGSPVWVGVHGITEFQASHEAGLEDDSDFDSEGYGSSTKTAERWSIVMTIARKVTVADATAYDAGQEFLRAKGIGTIGPANSAEVRWYEMEEDGPREEAYQGTGAVSWEPQGGAMSALSLASLTVTGQGRLTQIAHPE